MKTQTETDLVRQCLDWLALHGVFCWRQNSGAARYGPRYVRFHSEPGMTDIVGVLPLSGRIVCIEAKIRGARTERKRRLEQESFQQRIRSSGGVALVVHDLDELIDALRKEGVG